MKTISILLFSVFISGCILKKSNQPTGEIYKEDFKKIIDNYFGEYKPKLYNIIDKKDVTQYMSIDIDKKNMSVSQFNKVKDELKKDGWKLVDEHEGLYKFCLNEYQILSVLYPSQSKHYDSKGNLYKYDIYDNWALELNFNIYGIDYCMDGYYGRG